MEGPSLLGSGWHCWHRVIYRGQEAQQSLCMFCQPCIVANAGGKRWSKLLLDLQLSAFFISLALCIRHKAG